MKTSEPVVNLFPDFDDNLRNAFQRESELFFESIVREDRSVLDLLTADYTFVNERLAKHYGIQNIYGPQFRRVTLTPELDMRRGLLGKGALLTVTSNAARTSPVQRGSWFLQTFLGVAPPQPPRMNVNTMPGRRDARCVMGQTARSFQSELPVALHNPHSPNCGSFRDSYHETLGIITNTGTFRLHKIFLA